MVQGAHFFIKGNEPGRMKFEELSMTIIFGPIPMMMLHTEGFFEIPGILDFFSIY